MTQDKQLVSIQLQTTIDDHQGKEHVTTKQKGEYFQKDGVDILIYEEQTAHGIIRNFITIRPNRVNIKRSGIISMNQQFHLNQKTETYYEHPYGRFHMETFTGKITNQSMTEYEQGKLTIDYVVTLNETEQRKHLLELIYDKENVQ